ncbi:RES family NAD+ phosphorylase [Pedobacter puniceum]|jgi:RES domain-containing protein|uniref:RES domain-containing protein n=1 Tax=Pedobacter puniceum TaxID=2666136 RepID=A0A7K0FS99_9SPHI|nr:RES family NAD+ phosphorylase [Pedobacter puniceum]MRX47957.1 RES domain-containing protein [Pedobacter puniceum]
MLVYRIVLAPFADALLSSGRAARWNSHDSHVIYTASSISLACLENVVHRNKLGLNALFKVLYIDIPDDLPQKEISNDELPSKWHHFENIPVTQLLGNEWLINQQTAILKVPSSIIPQEFNYLLNPKHPDFKAIKLLKAAPFIFDERIKA